MKEVGEGTKVVSNQELSFSVLLRRDQAAAVPEVLRGGRERNLCLASGENGMTGTWA